MSKDFWEKTLDDAAVIVGGRCYHIGAEDSKDPFRRSDDGALWTIEFFDGRKVYTTNLWDNGKIPPELGVQDNARLLRVFN